MNQWLNPRIWRSPRADFYRDEPIAALDVYTDDELRAIHDTGFDGVWLRGRLYDLMESTVFPELNRPQADLRRRNLRELIQRARRHGVGVWLYFNEPLALPADDPFWVGQAEIIGQLPDGVELLADWERGGSRPWRDRTIVVDEYSLAFVGPSARFTGAHAMARQHHRPMHAKLQLDTTHELATRPSILLVILVQKPQDAIRMVVPRSLKTCWESLLRAFSVSTLVGSRGGLSPRPTKVGTPTRFSNHTPRFSPKPAPFALSVIALVSATHAATFTVTTTADSGAGSLGEANEGNNAVPFGSV